MKLVLLFVITCLLTVPVHAQVVNIPDANFKNALLSHVPVINTNNDGEIQLSEAIAFTGTMNVINKGIVNMTGVEAFSNMVTLSCQLNQITSLSTAGLTSLENLWCGNNKLTSLTVSNLPSLKTLYCFENLLTSVSLASLPALRELRCSNNKLSSISLNGFPSLTILDCYANLLTSISLSNVNALIALNCSANSLASLPINAMPNLQFLDCGYNQLTALPLTGLNALRELSFNNNQVSSLSLDNPGVLERLNCSFTNVTALPLGLNALKVLICKYARITSLSLNGSNNLNYLDFSGNLVTDFALSNKPMLTDLICISNLLTGLTISNMPALKYLRCDSNRLATLSVTNFPALHDLICTNNPLTTLTVSNLPSLWQLFCTNNKIRNLTVTNFPSLERLHCDQNELVSLTVNNLPRLNLFSCSGNLLTSLTLNNLPALDQVSCGNNRITSLSMINFPALRYLTCSNNKIQTLTLQNLPLLGNIQCQQNTYDTLALNGLPALYYLNCGRNDSLVNLSLTNLPALQRVDCDSTKLELMDLSQTGVKQIMAGNNPLLRYLNLKNNAFTLSSQFVDLRNNNSLEFICADSAEMVFLNSLLLSQLPGQNISVSTLCNYTPGAVNTIHGRVKFDENANGCNNLDSAMYNVKIKLDYGTQTGYTFTNRLGNYTFFVPQGTNVVTPVFEHAYFASTPASRTISFAGVGDTQVADFCVAANGAHPDLEISFLPLTLARPGFSAGYRLVYRNKGNHVQSGTIDLAYEDIKLNFASALPAVSGQTPNHLTWTFTGLSPYETRTIHVSFNVEPPPVVNIDDILNFTAIIEPVTGDETPGDNTIDLKQVVRGAFDPNDKMITEGPQVHISKAGNYLHYLVRFQNTGNEAAVNVVIKDSLADNLDWNTLIPIDASHAYRTVISKGNNVEFVFENINLPGRNTNEPGSHGFIAFKIKPLSPVTIGATVYNKAAIYFDFNLPVITNTVATTFITDPVYVPGDNLIGLNVFPNPVQNDISFTIRPGLTIKTISIYNTLGERVYWETVKNSGTSKKIDITHLPGGILFLKVLTDGGKAYQKISRIR